MLSIGIWPPSLGNATAAAVSAVDDDVAVAAVDGNAAAAAAVDDAAAAVEVDDAAAAHAAVEMKIDEEISLFFHSHYQDKGLLVLLHAAWSL